MKLQATSGIKWDAGGVFGASIQNIISLPPNFTKRFLKRRLSNQAEGALLDQSWTQS